VVSLACWTLERISPWRSNQKAFRDQFGQDLFWLVFNGHYAGLLLAYVAGWVLQPTRQILDGTLLATHEAISLLSNSSPWVQFVVFLVMKDFLEWGIHNLLHRIPWLWEFHKLHHSIRELDWIGNMRFHWMEIAIYHSLTYFPLVMLGVNSRVILWIAVFTTIIGHLNHSNLKLNWGIFRYVLNSPRLHIWHHDVVLHGRYGQNFGVVFSFWDFLFGTAYLPAEERPVRLGFSGMEKFPQKLLPRLLYPFWNRRSMGTGV
jgi:sterol desaturase/sphingolipid hydroxylase (fatty acid hydroxylase superfamily)